MPNAFATVEGEAPFYEKILPWLEIAERWMLEQFVGTDACHPIA